MFVCSLSLLAKATDDMSCLYITAFYIGVRSILALRDLLALKNASTTIQSIVATHLFTDEGIEEEMNNEPVGSVAYVVCNMKRLMLLEQVIAEVKELWHKDETKIDSTRCQRCKTLYFYEESTSSNTCKQCGLSVFVIENNLVSFHARSRYNRNARHVYAKHEHFFQTLLDMTCTGKRKVSLEIVQYCKAMLGRGKHITFQMVFKTLQIAGYTAFYNIKYEIAARLRGEPEIVLSMRETEMLRGHYRRYDACFHDFQVANRIGNRSQSGRLRLYWPVRFIMVEMFRLIGRGDLVHCVKEISGPKRLANYKFYWTQLRRFVNHRKPISRDAYTPVLVPLGRKTQRLTYSQYRQQEQQQKRQRVCSSSSSSSCLSSS